MTTPSSGFAPPTYTQVPNELFAMLPDLSHGELCILLAIIRETFGWHRPTCKLSLSQLQQLTGLSRPTVVATLRQCLDRGLIQRHADNDSYRYSLVIDTEAVKKVDHPQLNDLTTPSKITLPPLVKSFNYHDHDPAQHNAPNEAPKERSKERSKESRRNDAVASLQLGAIAPEQPEETDNADRITSDQQTLPISDSEPPPPSSESLIGNVC